MSVLSPDQVVHLLRYGAWANQETLQSLRRMATPPPRAVARLAHIAAAEQLWWGRLQDPPRVSPVWPQLDLDGAARLLEESSGHWLSFMETLEPADLSHIVGYTNSKGERFENTVGDILMHVALHGAYHRGQIASDVRAAGGDPAYTDYIHAVRSRAL